MTRLYRFRLYRVLFLVLIVFYLAAVAAPGWAQFETRTVQPLPFGAFSIATGDFNHDGNLDIAVVDDNGFSVSLGKGDGTFRRPTQYAATGFSIAAGDFNNDGDIDLVMANGDASVSVYLGNGDGTFRLPKTTATTENCSFLVIGNFSTATTIWTSLLSTHLTLACYWAMEMELFRRPAITIHSSERKSLLSAISTTIINSTL
jgi:hypothetical protein